MYFINFTTAFLNCHDYIVYSYATLINLLHWYASIYYSLFQYCFFKTGCVSSTCIVDKCIVLYFQINLVPNVFTWWQHSIVHIDDIVCLWVNLIFKLHYFFKRVLNIIRVSRMGTKGSTGFHTAPISAFRYLKLQFTNLLHKISSTMYSFFVRSCETCSIFTLGTYDKNPTYGRLASLVMILLHRVLCRSFIFNILKMITFSYPSYLKLLKIILKKLNMRDFY